MTGIRRVEGECARRFAPLRAALAENLAAPDALGQAAAVAIRGEVVVDLWGGMRDAAGTVPWRADTIACFFSVGKPIAALALGQLVERGEVRLAAPVTAYWPGYGQAGKAATTVDQLVSHLAGVPGVLAARPGSAYDWQEMVRAIEREPPLWPPGTRGCYHTFTYGHLVGEVVRRVTGKTIGAYLRESIAEPLGLSIIFGLTAEERGRAAEVVMTPGDPLLAAIIGDDTLIGRCWSALPLDASGRELNSEACRAAEIPAFNGHGDARSLARLYSLLAAPGGASPFSRALVDLLTEERWSGVDPLGLDNRMARGFRLGNDYSPFDGNPRAFGHSGIGGALAFGDPDLGLGFAFVTSRLAAGPGMSPAARRLTEALVRSLRG